MGIWMHIIAWTALVACGSSKPTNGTEGAMEANDSNTIVMAYEADEAVWPNPERGFYQYTDLSRLDPDIGRIREDGLSLVWGKIDMEAYRDRDALPADFVAAVEAGFNTARDQGLKVIVRGSYGFKGPGGDYTSYEDPPLARIKGHIGQLAPLFTAHADVIALFEAGFVGPWGEWHTSGIARDFDQGRDVLSFLLEHSPAGRMVLLRYPYLKQQLFKDAAGGFAKVDAANAYSGLPVARVGHHNDCFLASASDMGTYGRGDADRQEETAYLAAETLYTVFGGETCQPHRLNDCGRAVDELATLHASYLNRGYHPEVLDKWRQQGCYDEIERRLGARLVLRQSRVAARGRAGGRLAVEVTLENRGFAPLYNPRPVELVLEQTASGRLYPFLQDEDPRAWKPGRTWTFKAELALPQDMEAGTYRLYLALPDSSPRLQDDSRYAYRLANSGVWDAERGYNELAEGIEVQASR